MESSTVLIIAFSSAFVAGIIVFLTCKMRSVRNEASLTTELEANNKIIEERDARLAEMKKAQEDLLQKNDSYVAATNEKIENLNTSITELEAKKAELLERIDSTERAKKDAIEAKDNHLRLMLESKEADFSAKLAERDHSLEKLIQAKNESHEEQKRLLADTEKLLADKFGAVSLESLKQATAEFLKLANERFEKAGEVSKADLEKRQEAIDQLLKPVAETLVKLDQQNKQMEEKRVSAFDAIEKGIKNLSIEADQLANALRKPTSRGAWGEMNLCVILENAGLIEGEHFDLQDSTTDGEEGRLRTDAVIHLPNGRDVIIDSKAPLESFWEGMNAPDEVTRQAKFQAHSRLVREHVKSLSSKAYWNRYKASPDCVVMFIPTEGAYQAAIECDPSLLSDAHKGRVYIANPMTIINMIHLTAYILKEDRLKMNAQEVQSVATELYRRLSKFVGNISSMGNSLRVTVNHYNSAVGSLDSRVLPQARKISQLGAGSGEEISDLSEIEAFPRGVLSPELNEQNGNNIMDSNVLQLEASK